MSKTPSPELSPLQRYLEELHEKNKTNDDGHVADYIPELSHADPAWFGIALVTADGDVYQVGDTQEQFTIQSISKIISYGLALQDHGVDYVTQKVGVEPSGDAFNSISLDPETGQPRNPMINAGAIATTSLIKEQDGQAPIDRLLKTMQVYVGHPLTVNEAVYLSESRTGHRNRAIGYMLRNFDIIEEDPTPALETYFQQCSINVTCRDLAVMAGCLANHGINPITGEIALESDYVHKVLSVMGSCGMYNYSGNWLYRVGMPSKSGVGGGILAVLPGQFGLAVFSPRLDDLGNSVRGIKVCEQLSSGLGFHSYDAPTSTSSSTLRVSYTAAQIHSRKKRTDPEYAYLSENGEKVLCYELQGQLMFASTESLVQRLMSESNTGKDFLVVDMKRVIGIDKASSIMFQKAVEYLAENKKHLFFTGTDNLYSFKKHIRHHTGKDTQQALFQFDDRDHALEWCENQLIATSPINDQLKSVEIADNTLCDGFDSEGLKHFESAATRYEFKPGDVVVEQGASADSMFLVVEGELEVVLEIDKRHSDRLTTLLPGMSFGQLALFNEQKRTATVKAVTDSVCYEIKFADIQDALKTKLFANIAQMLANKIARDEKEIKVLSQAS